jgi:hypothetical protein
LQSPLLWTTVLLLLGIGGAAWYVVQRQETSTRDVADKTVLSSADLKAGQIEGWIKERRVGATPVRSNAGLRRLISAPQDPGARAMVGESFRNLQQAYDYDVVAVFDARGVGKGSVRVPMWAGFTRALDWSSAQNVQTPGLGPQTQRFECG